MRMRARVKRVLGTTRHRQASRHSADGVSIEDLPDPIWVEIRSADGAYYLLYLNAEGLCLADTWHETMEKAKAQARFEFDISDEEWFDCE
jgi:hypothetical protein